MHVHTHMCAMCTCTRHTPTYVCVVCASAPARHATHLSQRGKLEHARRAERRAARRAAIWRLELRPEGGEVDLVSRPERREIEIGIEVAARSISPCARAARPQRWPQRQRRRRPIAAELAGLAGLAAKDGVPRRRRRRCRRRRHLEIATRST